MRPRRGRRPLSKPTRSPPVCKGGRRTGGSPRRALSSGCVCPTAPRGVCVAALAGVDGGAFGVKRLLAWLGVGGRAGCPPVGGWGGGGGRASSAAAAARPRCQVQPPTEAAAAAARPLATRAAGRLLAAHPLGGGRQSPPPRGRSHRRGGRPLPCGGGPRPLRWAVALMRSAPASTGVFVGPACARGRPRGQSPPSSSVTLFVPPASFRFPSCLLDLPVSFMTSMVVMAAAPTPAPALPKVAGRRPRRGHHWPRPAVTPNSSPSRRPTAARGGRRHNRRCNDW